MLLSFFVQFKKILYQAIFSNPSGADHDSVDENGLTPLLWACANGQYLTARYLLDQHADLEATGTQGENCLLFACCYGYLDILKHLLQLGMNVDYTDEVRTVWHKIRS